MNSLYHKPPEKKYKLNLTERKLTDIILMRVMDVFILCRREGFSSEEAFYEVLSSTRTLRAIELEEHKIKPTTAEALRMKNVK